MTHYRTHYSSNRELFKINGDTVTRVVNMMESASLKLMNSPMMRESILKDKVEYPEATEEEFNIAFKNARDRILLERL